MPGGGGACLLPTLNISPVKLAGFQLAMASVPPGLRDAGKLRGNQRGDAGRTSLQTSRQRYRMRHPDKGGPRRPPSSNWIERAVGGRAARGAWTRRLAAISTPVTTAPAPGGGGWRGCPVPVATSRSLDPGAMARRAMKTLRTGTDGACHGRRSPPAIQVARMAALMWSMDGAVHLRGRSRFSPYLRCALIAAHNSRF